MRLIFLYGQVASGKLTVAKVLAARTGYALFHNHLIVDAVAAVFPFGAAEFIRLREQLWFEVIRAAVEQDRSMIFTFAPEPTIRDGIVERVAGLVESGGGEVLFVALRVDAKEQERRISAPDRKAFGKLQSLDLLRDLRADFTACMDAMPTPSLRIDTTSLAPDAAADQILAWMSR